MGVTYLDHAATSPLRAEVRDAMAAVWDRGLGNPSGAHRLAREARRVLDDARDEVAAVLGCGPGEVVFTGGGTEADNLAILGLADPAAPGSAVCPAAEHHAVLHAVEAVGGTIVGVDRQGRVDLDALAGALQDGVRVVSVMLANNEVGTVNDLAAVADVVAGRALLHTDAVQAARWLDVAAAAAPADLVSVTAHKLGGPVGIGALVVRAAAGSLRARQVGGGQERDRRSGTNDVAGAVGLATALRLAATERAEVVERVGKLRDRLADGLRAAVPGLVETAAADGGGRAHLVAGTCHVCVPGVAAEAVLFLLDEAGVCASAASSCASGAQQASHVLAAMGVPLDLASGSLRLSLGPTTTDADIDRALEVLPRAVEQVRG